MACPHTPPPDAASRPGVRLVGDEYFTAIALKVAEEEHAVDSAQHSSVETTRPEIVKKEKEKVQRSAPAPKDSTAEAPKDEVSKAPSINEKEENTRKFTLSGPEFHEMTSLRERLSAKKTVKSPHASPVAETREDAATSISKAGASPHLDGKPSALQHDWSGFENYEADDDDHAFEVLTESFLQVTLRRRRFILLIGMAVGLIAPWGGHAVGLVDMGAYRPPRSLGFYSNFSNFSIDDLNFSLSFRAYVDKSRSAFNRARLELLEFAPSDVKLLSQLREVMDFTRESRATTETGDRPGTELWKKGVRAKHPVVLVPGIVTTGLELWSGKECAKSYFRQRMWGTMSMLQIIMLNTRCWLQHMSLRQETGLDPADIKVRAAQGFEAADYVVGGYWVWAKLIENLADIGYDPSMMTMAPYDWRLPAQLLEERDGYLSTLASSIETMVKHAAGRKVVIVSHSMGGTFMLYFLQWVTKERGHLWLHTHIHALIKIAVPALGVPKSVAALLSGESRDTAELGMLAAVEAALNNCQPVAHSTFVNARSNEETVYRYDLERMLQTNTITSFTRAIRRMPAGCWGCCALRGAAPDFVLPEELEKARIAGGFLYLEDRPLDAEEAVEFLLEHAKNESLVVDGQLLKMRDWYSWGIRQTPFPEPVVQTGKVCKQASPESPATGGNLAGCEEAVWPRETGRGGKRGGGGLGWWAGYEEQREESQGGQGEEYGKSWEGGDRKTWYNPLESRLPFAPSMTMYALYGVGKPTERTYFFRKNAAAGSLNGEDTGDGTRYESLDHQGPPYTSATALPPRRDGIDTEKAEEQWGKGCAKEMSKESQVVEVVENEKGGASVQGLEGTGDGTMTEVEWRIDTECTYGGVNCSNGLIKGHGDGTVPLISAGFMCVRGWPDYHHWNPSRVRCKVREYEHQPAPWDFRGGDSSGDHVDIMGNRNMISDVLHIASGEDLEERIVSQIREMSARIILPESIR